MINLRKSDARGKADHGWLLAKHSFSFSDYYDVKHMEFSVLRVINEDRVAPAKGFGTHPHRDMEIITYVLEGSLEHKDSMGNGSTIFPGDVQYMSAGTGVRHSEKNPSPTEGLHLMQIWIEPDEVGAVPRYAQKSYSLADKTGKLCLVASKSGESGSIAVRQDIKLFACRLTEGDSVDRAIKVGRKIWVQVARGAIELNGQRLDQGDGAALTDEKNLTLRGLTDGAEFLLFDLP